jgi:hypothetical protein
MARRAAKATSSASAWLACPAAAVQLGQPLFERGKLGRRAGERGIGSSGIGGCNSDGLACLRGRREQRRGVAARQCQPQRARLPTIPCPRCDCCQHQKQDDQCPGQAAARSTRCHRLINTRFWHADFSLC